MARGSEQSFTLLPCRKRRDAHPHVLLLILLFTSFLFLSRVLLTSSSPPCARQQDILQATTQGEIPVLIEVVTLSSSLLQLYFLLHRSAHALGQQHPTDTSHLYAVAVHPPFLRSFRH